MHIKLLLNLLMILSYQSNNDKDISFDSINGEKINEIEEILSRQSKLK